MQYKYGEFSQNQISETKNWIRKQIFFLLLIVDPQTKQNYENESIDVVKSFDGLLHKLGGLNSILNEPPELVRVISLLEAALIEFNKTGVDVENFRGCTYRKLILDAGSEVLKIKEV